MKKGLLIPVLSLYVFILILDSFSEPFDVTAATTNTGIQTKRVYMKASYKKMKKSGKFDTNKIVFKEIPPNVHLDDLAVEPIYKGNPQKTMVALMINFAWGNEYIPTILKVSNESRVKATFFHDGSRVKKNPDLAKMIYKEGHEIGNHA